MILLQQAETIDWPAEKFIKPKTNYAEKGMRAIFFSFRKPFGFFECKKMHLCFLFLKDRKKIQSTFEFSKKKRYARIPFGLLSFDLAR